MGGVEWIAPSSLRFHVGPEGEGRTGTGVHSAVLGQEEESSQWPQAPHSPADKVREASNASVPLVQQRTLVCMEEVLTVSVKAHSSCSFRTFLHDWTINHLKMTIQNHNDN